MKANTANISFAKDHLCELIDRVSAGHTITILDRRRPVARLSPIPPEEDKGWIQDLVRQGVVSEPRKRPSRSALARMRPVRLKGNADIVAALIADREDRV
jgi:antitoxin (DNA-binding transcriptional repressor) of toxin-antitoxin stability system